MIKFKYQRYSAQLGEILRPMADVVLEAKRHRVEVSMCVDSGADISMIPFRFGRALGFRQKPTDKILEIRGVSGGGVPYVIRRLNLIMNNQRLSIRIAWALIEEVPLLLGRMDVFSKFKITFDEKQELITLHS